MGVTEVVRGSDLLSSTARQLYLYRLLGLQAPTFAHCPLLLAPDGRRLSKRDGDQSLENLREKYTAQEIVGKLAYAYGLQPEPAPARRKASSGFFLGKGAQAGRLPAGGAVLNQTTTKGEAHVFGALPPFCFVGHCPAVSGRGILKGSG